MPLPRIAIVGRPNVGKSSLLNMLARDKVSIVDDTPGTTRDRVSIITDLTPPGDHQDSAERIPVEVTDTGGFGVYVVDGRRYDDVGADLSSLTKDIEFQISQAVAGADLVLFVLDAQAGITAHDQTIARLIRERIIGDRGGKKARAAKAEAEARAGKAEGGAGAVATSEPSAPARIMLVANKTDGPRWEAHAYEAAALGFGEPLCVSAKNNYFRREFLDRLYEAVAELPSARTQRRIDEERARETETGMRLAIIGKRNAGKSMLVNALAGAPRVIVSEIAGTTRDAVDVRFEMDGKTFTAIDTAGLRRKKSFADRIEWWAFDRAQRSIDRADVVLMLVDATVPPSQVDEQLAALCAKRFKPTILVVNKWDLVEGRVATAGRGRGKPITPETYSEYLRNELKALMDAPIAFISAKNKTNLPSLIRLAIEMHEQAGTRVGTGELNRLLKNILATRGPSSKLGTFAKAYFVAQVAVHPPTIVMVVNKPELFTVNYQRFLLNAFRKATPFAEVPIKLIVKKRSQARDEDLAAGAEQEERERRASGRGVGSGRGAAEADWAESLPTDADAYFDDDASFDASFDVGEAGGAAGMVGAPSSAGGGVLGAEDAEEGGADDDGDGEIVVDGLEEDGVLGGMDAIDEDGAMEEEGVDDEGVVAGVMDGDGDDDGDDDDDGKDGDEAAGGGTAKAGAKGSAARGAVKRAVGGRAKRAAGGKRAASAKRAAGAVKGRAGKSQPGKGAGGKGVAKKASAGKPVVKKKAGKAKTAKASTLKKKALNKKTSKTMSTKGKKPVGAGRSAGASKAGGAKRSAAKPAGTARGKAGGKGGAKAGGRKTGR
ncbi:MAG: 50S ribosome-binding GTPase [Phycisphaeraceae bacterium]|nr:50S ribosome-binding GTPase [Phycisphaeraceae bacterium]